MTKYPEFISEKKHSPSPERFHLGNGETGRPQRPGGFRSSRTSAGAWAAGVSPRGSGRTPAPGPRQQDREDIQQNTPRIGPSGSLLPSFMPSWSPLQDLPQGPGAQDCQALAGGHS
ncbi:uncharacterized protein AAEQ78_019690 [Lycaon pictus]